MSFGLTLRRVTVMRNGCKRVEPRKPEVWMHCIQEHRRALHGGKRVDSCPACQEMEAKAIAAGGTIPR